MDAIRGHFVCPSSMDLLPSFSRVPVDSSFPHSTPPLSQKVRVSGSLEPSLDPSLTCSAPNTHGSATVRLFNRALPKSEPTLYFARRHSTDQLRLLESHCSYTYTHLLLPTALSHCIYPHSYTPGFGIARYIPTGLITPIVIRTPWINRTDNHTLVQQTVKGIAFRQTP